MTSRTASLQMTAAFFSLFKFPPSLTFYDFTLWCSSIFVLHDFLRALSPEGIFFFLIIWPASNVLFSLGMVWSEAFSTVPTPNMAFPVERAKSVPGV